MGGSARAHEAATGNIKVDKINYILLNYFKSVTYDFNGARGRI